MLSMQPLLWHSFLQNPYGIFHVSVIVILGRTLLTVSRCPYRNTINSSIKLSTVPIKCGYPRVTDTDENNLKMYLEENYELTSERVIKAGVDIVSNENKYHPMLLS